MSKDTHGFEGWIRSKNVASLELQAILIVILVPAFWGLDWLVVPEHVWWFLAARVVPALYAVAQLYAIRRWREWTEAHSTPIAYSLMLLVGWIIAAMCWIDDGYESPYYAGIGLVVVAFGFMFVWSLKVALSFLSLLYIFYMMPMALGVIVVKDPVMAFNNQFFLLALMVMSILARRSRYASELKEFESAVTLASSNRQLQELDRLKSQFFANVSHELRTPLTLSVGPIQKLLREPLADAHREVLDMVNSNQVRLLKLINDLLDFAKLEAGKTRLRTEPVWMQELLRRSMRTLELAAAERQMRVELIMPEEPLELCIDVDKMEKVILNLLSNAFKFTPDGGAIVVRLAVDAAAVEIAVQDSGIGIAKDKQTEIFERFVQGDASTSRNYAGTGIGLALVKEYVELHSGSVGVDSEVGKGATFCVRLPRRPLDNAAAAGELGKETSTVSRTAEDRETSIALRRVGFEGRRDSAEFSLADLPPPSRRTLTPAAQLRWSTPPGGHDANGISNHPPLDPDRACVLVVDDTADMRRYVRSLLEGEYQIISARDGEQALHIARNSLPDLVLADVMMPRMSGDELCRLIKADKGPLGRVPVVLMTARADEQSRLEGLQEGADDYLAKPFHIDELRLRVRNLVLKTRFERSLVSAHQELSSYRQLMRQDLAMASKFQQRLLVHPKVPAPFSLQVHYQPMIEVGGDMYDVEMLDQGRLRLLLIDATGHGVQAAFRAGAILREYQHLKRSAGSPGELLSQLNDKLAQEADAELTFAGLCLDLQLRQDGTCEVRYARTLGAPLWVLSSSGAHPAEGPPSMLAGVFSRLQYPTLCLELGIGERLFCASDGLLEQADHFGQQFQSNALSVALNRAAAAISAEDSVQQVIEAWQSFRSGAAVLDDVTVMSVGLSAAMSHAIPSSALDHAEGGRSL